MNIIISGTSGFVGQNLFPYLTERGYSIHSLSLHGRWKETFPLKCDGIIHLAGKAHDTNNTSDSQEYFFINTDLTKQLFDKFLQSTARDFIYFSSVKAVADKSVNPLTEEVKPNPKTPYGQSKLRAEEYLLKHKLSGGKRLIIIRPCMIHGPGNKGNLNLLYKVVKLGIPYPLAAFENRRSFLSIDNLLFIIEQLLNNQEIPGGIYNVADDDPLSTIEVIRIIGKGSNSKPWFWNLPPSLIRAVSKAGDKLHLPLNSERLSKLTENYIVSNDKIKQILNVQSLPLSSDEGLLKTIRSFNQ